MKKFSLVELLMVVAIIGILTSLLVPSLSKARKTSRETICKNNQRQLSIGATMHAMDNDNIFPIQYENSGNMQVGSFNGYEQTGLGHVRTYENFSNPSLWHCPLLDTKKLDTTGSGTGFYMEESFNDKGYGMKYWTGIKKSHPNKKMNMGYSYRNNSFWLANNRSSHPKLTTFESRDVLLHDFINFKDYPNFYQYHHKDGYIFTRVDGSVIKYRNVSGWMGQNLSFNFNGRTPVAEERVYKFLKENL